MTKEWLTKFWDAYKESADRAKADAPGGAEFRRVLTSALDLTNLDPKDFTSFIETEANQL